MNEVKTLKNRRHWLIGAVAGAATLGGVGMAWEIHKPHPTSATAEAALWLLELSTPQGQIFRMDALRGRPTIVNFWATWCPPCVDELPLLSQFYTENIKNGWQVLGLAVDQRDAVNRFLSKTAVTFPVAMAGMPGIEISRSLGNLSGSLPFTVVLGSSGQVAHRKMGRITPEDLLSWVALK